MDVMARRHALLNRSYLLPPIYRPVEYIEATGEQYLAIPVSNVIDQTFEITCQLFDNGSTGVLISFLTSEAGNWFGNSGGYYSIGGGNNLTRVVLGEKIKAMITRDDSQIIAECNGQTITRVAAGSAGNTLGIFAVPNRKTYFSHGRLYSVVSAGIVNLIPCVRASDEKPGLFDAISKTFYTNAGTVEFVIPN